MTVEEKREALDEHCHMLAGCNSCPFGDMNCDFNLWDDEQVNTMYKLIEPEVAETPKEEHDPVNHPSHYCNGGIECIDEMIMVFGEMTVANFCLCNVWKYRKRALYKNGEEDLKKADWYMAKYKELIEHGRN